MYTLPPRTKKGEIYRQYLLRQEKDKKRWIKKAELIKAEEESELIKCLFVILYAQHMAKVAPKERKRRLSKNGIIYKVNQRIKQHQQKMYFKRKHRRLSTKLAEFGLSIEDVKKIVNN